MTERRVLLASVLIAALLVLVGLYAEGRPGCLDGQLRFEAPVCIELASPPLRGSFEGELREDAGSGYRDHPGDSPYWYWAGATVLALGIGFAATGGNRRRV